MKILKVELEKFKCFKKATIDLSKITILTGANSSGKSSFLYSILSMLQSEKFPFFLSPNGKYVDLGSFEELSLNNDREGTINISYKIEAGKNYFQPAGVYFIKTSWVENRRNKLTQLESLSFSGELIQIAIVRQEGKYLLTIVDKTEQPFLIEKTKARLLKLPAIQSAKKFQLKRTLLEVIEAPFNSITEIFEKVFANDDYYIFLEITKLLSTIHDRLNFKSNFIGSFRDSPQRTYYQKSKAEPRVKLSGEGYIDQVVEWEETNPAKFIELNSQLNKLQLLKEIKSKKLEGGRFELQVRVTNDGPLASLTDVGFGISQFMPIIVSDMQLSTGSLLMMSQPETHLHPKIQAMLGDYFTTQIKEAKKRYIVETHSEYLLNRIRLNITKGLLSPRDIAIYYFTNTDQGTQIQKISFTKKGEIKNAPKDFFDTYMMDVLDIALNS